MIVTKTSEYEVTGTITGEKIDLSFDENSLVHIMSVLTDLYSDPELAILREYSTNALDAHIEAGVARPIEISTPSALSPFLKIKDYGVGLSVDDLRNVYAKYGASTKRDTNDQVGMLGLGCKSALTYTNQFTVTAIKNGQRSTVSISRDENGAGSITVVETVATSEPNGVEVVIPIRRHNTIAGKALNFFRFWAAGTVLVDGKAPEHISGLKVTDKLTIVKEHQSYIVMGNVAYPASIPSNLPYGHAVVAYVEIGEIHFTPSREALHMTALTKSTIEQVQATLKEHTPAAVQRAVSEAATPQAAVQAAVEWKRILPASLRPSQFTHKGKALPDEYKGQVRLVARNSSKQSACSDHPSIDLSHLPNTVWLTGYTKLSFTAGQRKKIDKWAEDNSIQCNYYALVDATPDMHWLDPAKVHAWAPIEAIKLPRNTPGISGRIPGSFDCYVNGKYTPGMPADDIDTSEPVYFLVGKQGEAYEYNKLLSTFEGDFTLVWFGTNREEKFVRCFPEAMSARKMTRTLYEVWEAGLSDAEGAAMRMYANGGGMRGELSVLNPSKIDDPEIIAAIAIAKTDLTKALDERKMFANVDVHRPIGAYDGKNPLRNYPLYDRYEFRSHEDHIYLYLNLMYKHSQTTKESK